MNMIYIKKIKKLDSTNYYLECQVQISDVCKKTDEYRQITILSNTKCSMNSENEGESQTVGDIFKNYEESSPIETTNPDENRTFIFKFENGKCTEVISTLTSI